MDDGFDEILDTMTRDGGDATLGLLTWGRKMRKEKGRGEVQ